MGSGSSKTASSTAKTASKLSSTPRKYPSRPQAPSNRTNTHPTQSPAADKVGPSVNPQAGSARVPSEGRNRGVELDASDPDLGLAARLSQLGPVQPNPTQSNSSTFNHSSSHTPPTSQFRPSASTPTQSIFPDAKQNPTVSLLTARYRLAEEAEREFENTGRKGSEGRQFLDVVTIRQILMLRDEKGVESADIERRLGLRSGVVGRLGRKGVVYPSS